MRIRAKLSYVFLQSTASIRFYLLDVIPHAGSREQMGRITQAIASGDRQLNSNIVAFESIQLPAPLPSQTKGRTGPLSFEGAGGRWAVWNNEVPARQR